MMDSVLLAGALPGAAAGNSVSTATLLPALQDHGPVTILTHHVSPVPSLRHVANGSVPAISLGVQPLLVHAEAELATRLHRRRLTSFSCGWAVNSRYAAALRFARIPYLIWEATTLRDELAVTDVIEARRSGRGTGIGVLLHRSFLPLDERFEASLYRDAVAVLTMSQYTAERVCTRYRMDEAMVRVLPHPPGPDFLAALSRTERVCRGGADRGGAVRAASSSIRMLFVGRVDDPRKNFALLREAYLSLRGDGVRIGLTIIGPYGTELRRSRSLEQDTAVRFLGRVDDDTLANEMLLHDVLVVPSRQEGFGIVVAEAMHAGLPVISTRCGGPEQVLRESGGGVLVGHSVDELASAIARLAADPAMRVAMGARGRAYAERELSTSRFHARVADAHELLRSKSHVKNRRTSGADA